MNDRPLSVGRLLLKTHELYWQHFPTFVGLLAIPHLPVAFPSVLPDLVRSHVGVVGVLLVVAWGLVYLVAWTALIWAVAAALRGEEIGAGLAFSRVRLLGLGRLVWSHLVALCLFLLMVLAGAVLIGLVGAFARAIGRLLAVLFGLVLGACRSNGFRRHATENAIAHLAQVRRSRPPQCVSIPSKSRSDHFSDTLLVGSTLWWFLRLLFLPQVVVLEGRGGLAAISRCAELVKGRRLRVLVILLLFTLLEGLLTWALGSVPVLRYLAGLLVAPLGAIWVTLLYYERVDPGLLSPAKILSRGMAPRLS